MEDKSISKNVQAILKNAGKELLDVAVEKVREASTQTMAMMISNVYGVEIVSLPNAASTPAQKKEIEEVRGQLQELTKQLDHVDNSVQRYIRAFIASASLVRKIRAKDALQEDFDVLIESLLAIDPNCLEEEASQSTTNNTGYTEKARMDFRHIDVIKAHRLPLATAREKAEQVAKKM